ncbi:MAG: RHS repeat-associated core domain-containing protein [Bacteriovoracaceae bacterium]|nr:RHS repeat-associated core domain-containing protein [Bacteriovoracaceae bacterium]
MRNTILNNETFTYFTDRDGLGDIIQKSNSSEMNLFEYRGDKKLKHFTLIKNNESTHVSYFYDALGRRVAKQVQTPTENFTNTFAHEAEQDKILIGKNGTGTETLYIDGQEIDEHLAEINLSSVKGHTVNHLGSVLSSSAIGSSNDTGAFGEILDTVSMISSSTEPVSYGFTGRQLDLESGIYFFKSRYYDQDSGKYLSSDQIGFKGGDYNSTRYVGNQPLWLTDPDGKRVDFGNVVISNDNVKQFLYNLNQMIVEQGISDTSFVIQVTGGDRYMNNGKAISRTDGKAYGDTLSRHLEEHGARAVDFEIFNEGANEGQSQIVKSIVREYVSKLPRGPMAYEIKANYMDDHFHIGLPLNLGCNL